MTLTPPPPISLLHHLYPPSLSLPLSLPLFLSLFLKARWRRLSKSVVYGVIAGSVVAALLTSFVDLDAFVSTYFGGVQVSTAMMAHTIVTRRRRRTN